MWDDDGFHQPQSLPKKQNRQPVGCPKSNSDGHIHYLVALRTLYIAILRLVFWAFWIARDEMKISDNKNIWNHRLRRLPKGGIFLNI